MEKNILVISSGSELARRTIDELKKLKGVKLYATNRSSATVIDEKVLEFHLDITQEENFINLKEKLYNIKFDTIINFAGVAYCSAVLELSETELRKQLDVNLFGLLRIIKYLAPLLKTEDKKKKIPKGKLINVSSMAAHGVFPFLSPYCLSKAGSDILLNLYSIESDIKTVSIRPGAVATKFWESSIELNKDKFNNKEHFSKEKEYLLKNAQINSLHAKNPIAVSKKIAQIVMKDNPKSVYNIGLDSKLVSFTRHLNPDVLKNIIKGMLKQKIK